jgi:benzoyl-CoA-dihydrodiol lyase
MMPIDFQTEPNDYQHWRIKIEGSTARLIMDVNENGGLFPDYELKLNSYDLGVDIELYDAIQRLRFEHPEVKVVILESRKDQVFCAGANIRMLASVGHGHKVNFCKFTNETRNSMEDASENSGQVYIGAIKGTCAGGGYELALATDHIILSDDGSSSVALPEVPLLAVLPGTGGLTRLTDKRGVRRDLADVFCTFEEGIKGQRAKQWRLVDEAVPLSQFDECVAAKVEELTNYNRGDPDIKGITFNPINRDINDDVITYSTLIVSIDRDNKVVTIVIEGPLDGTEFSLKSLAQCGDQFWPLRLARELDDAILHLRFNEPELGIIVFKSSGNIEEVARHDTFMQNNLDNWLVREITLYWKRTMKRIDLTSRSLITLIEQGSCFAGFLSEIVFSADRAYMLEGQYEDDERPPAALVLTQSNFSLFPMSNGISRLHTRFHSEPESLQAIQEAVGQSLDALQCEALGLVTFVYDDLDWDDEVRIFLEERNSFSADSLVGMEANLRFAGPETMETKIFGRLTAWQNWIFQRPSAVGEDGALKRYGTGKKGVYDPERV